MPRVFTPALWYYRERPLMLLAIAAVTSRLWIYNLNTSNLILVFLLPGALAALDRNPRYEGRRLFLAVGASLWVPARLSENHVIQLAEHLIWLGGLIGLRILDRHRSVSDEVSIPAERARAAQISP